MAKIPQDHTQNALRKENKSAYTDQLRRKSRKDAVISSSHKPESGLKPKQHIRMLTSLLFCLFSAALLLSLIKPFINTAYNTLTNSTVLSICCFSLGLIYLLVWMTVISIPNNGLAFLKPKFTYLKSCIIASLLLCLGVTVLKWYLLSSTSAQGNDGLFYIANMTTPYWEFGLLLLAYIIFAVVQTFIFQGLIEGMMIRLTAGTAKGFFVVTLSTLFFCMIHDTISHALALLVFLPGLLWCWLYYLHRNFWPIVISHMIIGAYCFFVLGITPIETLITNFISATT